MLIPCVYFRKVPSDVSVEGMWRFLLALSTPQKSEDVKGGSYSRESEYLSNTL